MTPMQLHLKLTTREHTKKVWAFAVDMRGIGRRRQAMVDITHYVISACSAEAKALGIKAGMRYVEAKTVLPEMKIMLIGARNV
ncbi:MAG: hypothetical protein NVS1B7_7120 [Candidatus Saccharimonadales bacterium]